MAVFLYFNPWKNICAYKKYMKSCIFMQVYVYEYCKVVVLRMVWSSDVSAQAVLSWSQQGPEALKVLFC